MNSLNKPFETIAGGSSPVISGLRAINDLYRSSTASLVVGDFFDHHIEFITTLEPDIVQALCYSRVGHLMNKADDLLYLVGKYPRSNNTNINDISTCEATIQKAIDLCLERKKHIFSGDTAYLYLTYEGFDAVMYVKGVGYFNPETQLLFESYATMLSLKMGNFNLKNKLKRLAHIDWLTRLPNRSEFLKQIGSQKEHHFEQLAVALVDINHFSDINDGLGMDIGSALLVSVAKRLQDKFPNEGQLGRISGDVFGILADLSEIEPSELALIFESPFLIGGHTIPINVSIGVCKLDFHHDGSHYLRCATIALNHAKHSLVSSYSFYDSEMDQQTKKKLEMIRLLQRAFENKELELWYQPQVDLISENVIGLEALLRWKYNDNTYVSPEEFIPLAEYSGLILGIGEWVIEQATQTLAELQNRGQNEIRISVNVSVLQFRSSGFVEFICDTLEKHSVMPHFFELEITESVVMDDPQLVIKALNELKAKGFKIALDDFGTGFSSLSYLQKLPLDRLKVDKSFVKDLNNPKHRVIAKSIFSLGSQLGLQTIAEGVETRSQASQMLRLGADEAQGFLYSKAIPFERLSSYLLKNFS